MPSATFNKFDAFIEAVFEAKHNFATDTVKFYLTNEAPLAADAVKADIAEIAAGNGYTAGGYAMTVTASGQTGGTYTAAVNVDQTITASGGNLPAARYAVAYNDTSVDKKLIGYWDYGSSFTVQDGESFRFVLAGNLITAS